MTLKFVSCPLVLGALIAGVLSSPYAQAAGKLKDGSFETPVVPVGGYNAYATGQKMGPWMVVGSGGDVDLVSGTFTQNGFDFDSKKGVQFVDLTGLSNAANGVQEAVATVPGTSYTVTFYVGTVYDSSGLFGTSSTVNLFVDGAPLASFTAQGKKKSTKMQWHKFSTDFVAANGKTTLAFINGDSGADNMNGLDGVSVASAKP